MFEIVVNKVRNFNVIVRDFSKIDSLISNVKYGTYKIVSRLSELINMQRSTFSSSIGIKISGVIEKINPRITASSKNKVTSNLNSIESFGNKTSNSVRKMDIILSSKENLSTSTKSTLRMISDPLVGYFRKLTEFNNLNLSELDEFTLEEMDYILTLMDIASKE